MKIMYWSYRGLGNPRTIQTLRSLFDFHKLNIIFLSKMKLRSSELYNRHFGWNLSGCFAGDPVG